MLINYPEYILGFIVIGVILLLNIIAMLLFVIYAKSTSRLKTSIETIIYELDKFADNMSNEQKKSKAITDIQSLLGWKKFFIPPIVIGLIIDLQVAAIRKMQVSTNTPNLHREEDE